MMNNVITFAKKKHGDQKYNGENYVDSHLKKVADETLKLAQATKCKTPHLAYEVAYLHDTIEDTKTTEEEIENKFGKEVAKAVEVLSNIDEKGRKKAKDDYYREISENHLAKIVKAADRISNIKMLSQLKDKRFKDKLTERYKKEIEFYEKYNIFPELIKKAFEV